MQLSTLPSALAPRNVNGRWRPRATGGNRTHNLRFTKPLHYRCATVASFREPITIRAWRAADKGVKAPLRILRRGGFREKGRSFPHPGSGPPGEELFELPLHPRGIPPVCPRPRPQRGVAPGGPRGGG